MTKTFTKKQVSALARAGHIAVEFTKTDGTTRRMICTLEQEFLPPKHDSEIVIPPAKGHDDLLAVWDLERAGWRSFRISSLTSVITLDTPPSELVRDL